MGIQKENIVSIVMGMVRGELVKPYDASLSKDFISKVYRRIQEKDSFTPKKITIALSKIREIAKSEDRPLLEVYGIWEESCVYIAVRIALNNGLKVIVPKEFILTAPNSKYTLVSEINGDNEWSLGRPSSMLEDEKFYYFKPIL